MLDAFNPRSEEFLIQKDVQNDEETVGPGLLLLLYLCNQYMLVCEVFSDMACKYCSLQMNQGQKNTFSLCMFFHLVKHTNLCQ